MLNVKTVTIPKATAGTSWSPTSRNIGTTDSLFGLNVNNVKSVQVRDPNFIPAANAIFGFFNNSIYVAATQSTTLSSDIKVDVIYTT